MSHRTRDWEKEWGKRPWILPAGVDNAETDIYESESKVAVIY